LPDTAELFDAPAGLVAEAPNDEVFVRALDLPTLSLRQARAAVAQQLDILSPLPPSEVVSSVVLIGPVEEGLNRFAVGLAPRALLIRTAQAGERTVTLAGRLEGEELAFRFDVPGAVSGKPNWGARLELATTIGACLAIVLAAVSLRLGGEIERARARVDDANARVQRLTVETASLARIGTAWRAAEAAHNAALLDCAFRGLAKAGGGAVTLAKVSVANGRFDARLAAPASEPTVTALRALGFAAGSAASDPTAAPAAVQDVQITTAACR
jgi:hypothetical protein